MLILTVTVDSEDILGVKETLAAYLERFGDVKVIQVETDGPPQQACFLNVERVAAEARAFRDTYQGK